MTGDPPDALVEALARRDQLLADWLLLCSPQEHSWTVEWLIDAEQAANRDILPILLRRAQERVMELLHETDPTDPAHEAGGGGAGRAPGGPAAPRRE